MKRISFLYILLVITSFKSTGFGQDYEKIEIPDYDWANDKSQSLEPLRVIGIDDRVSVNSRKNPYLQVGRIKTETGGYCSGSLVGNDLVLTAAHCIKDINKPETYYLGYKDGDYIDSATSIQVWLGWNKDKTRNTDWAIIKLDKPLGYTWGYLELEKNFHKLNNMRIVGFGNKWFKGKRMFEQTQCHISHFSKEEKNLFFHTCDTNPGTSGAPILNENNRIIGVHGGAIKKKPNRAVHVKAFRDLLEVIKSF